MYDIIPSGSSKSDRRQARPLRPQAGRKKQPGKTVYAGPRVVQVDWRLPARLRKPIREQLKKERIKTKKQQEVIAFKRRPLKTQPLLVASEDSRRTGARVKKPRRLFNRGSEHHTRDMHTNTKPQLQVAAPPYIGAGARRGGLSTRAHHSSASSSVSTEAYRSSPPESTPTLFAERDVPMQFSDNLDVDAVTSDDLFVSVDKPRRITAGVTFSLWPGHWFGRKKGLSEKSEARYDNPSTSANDHGQVSSTSRFTNVDLREGSLSRPAKKKLN